MPLYEYECQDCKTRSEVIQRFSDPPLTTCEDCGGTLTKLLSAPAFQLKGSGWYKTDYAASNSGNRSGPKDSEAKSESGETGEGRSNTADEKGPEKKPEKKEEKKATVKASND